MPKIAARIPLDFVELAFSGEPFVGEDTEHLQQEPRWFLVNRVRSRWMFVVFTLRAQRIRVVSARLMHRKESERYAAYFQEEKQP